MSRPTDSDVPFPMTGSDPSRPDEVKRAFEAYEARLAQMALLMQRLREEEAARIAELAELAHELKKPLTIIQNLLYLSPVSQTQLDEKTELTRAAHFLDRLIAFAHMRYLSLSDESASFDASALTSRAISLLVPLYPPLTPATSIAPGVTVVGSQEAYLHILENALENAGKYGGGQLAVTLTPERLTIEDNGPGLPPALLQDVRHFRRGTRAKPGSGLGLAIMRRAAEGSGWVITFENPPRGGLRISLELPRDAIPPTPPR